MIPVKGHPHLYRDEDTGAIINCDSQAYENYINMKTARDVQKTEIEQIKRDVNEIKSLLRELLNGTR